MADAPTLASTAPDPSGRDAESDLRSRRRARRWWLAFGAVALVAVAGMTWLGRKSSSSVPPAPKAFCKAAHAYEAELDRQQVAYKRDTAKQIEYVERIAATAPERVRADAQLFLDSLRRFEAATTKQQRDRLKDDPRIEEAIRNVNREWNQGCGVFDRQSGI